MSDDLRQHILGLENRIILFFRSRQLNREEVEDLSQEVFCRIYESISSFRGDASPGTWVYAICRNVYFEHLRKRRTLLLDFDERPIPVPDKTDYIDFQSLVQELPAYLKPVYDKRFRENLSIRDTALELSMKEGTVKYYIHMIRKCLRGMVQ